MRSTQRLCVWPMNALKPPSGATRYAPAREWGVLDNVVALNKGPLADHAIQAIYRDLVSGWFPLVTPP